MSQILGIHHVTAIASDPQRNLDFYVGLLGLRLVKRTVNFDDPQTYHLYYGDEVGSPGSILTFFPWPGARRGREGSGQVAGAALAVLPRALDFWVERLRRHGVESDGPRHRGSGADAERVVAFRDPDGMRLELVAHAAAETRGAWGDAPGIRREHAIHGLHGVTLWVEHGEATERALVDTLGFRAAHEEGATRRFVVGDGGPGRIVDVQAVAGFGRGAGGAGTVHHVAFEVADDAAEVVMRDRVSRAGLRPTPVIDRSYFHSIYFHEPGGVLFELATSPPGFAVDEPVAHLGERLMLPARYEAQRAEIEAVLPPLHLPVPARAAAALAAATGPEEVSGEALGFVHRFVPPSADGELAGGTTLLLLHGTGGDEDDLLPLGRAILPGAARLSPRGRVLERGAPRFFRRHAEGVFDVEDLARRTDELADFVVAAAATYRIARDGIVAVGFSNGANVAASLLLRRPGVLRAAILLSPVLPFEPDVLPDLRGTAVFIATASGDRIAPPAQAQRLAALLQRAGAEVTVHLMEGGHAIDADEVEAARAWLLHRLAADRAGASPSAVPQTA
jgi:predicted esterase/catechol 2,3-dioxygenase-like lactoylglutathione lyase family enzyme